MCLITYKPADAVLDLKNMEEAFYGNSDGWGLMAHKPAGVEVVKLANPKAADDKQAFEKFVEAYEVRKEFPLGVHFRMRTHGAIDLDNTHPYSVLRMAEGDPTDLWLMHNGVIRNFGQTTYTGRSDTGEFIDEVLRPLFRRYHGLWTEEIFHAMVESVVGSNNKMLIMGTHLEHPIFINRASGNDDGKLWYSNNYSFRRKSGVVTRYNSTYFRNTHWHGPWNEDDVQPTLPAVGGGSKSGAPFCPTTESSESSGSSSEKKERSSGEGAGLSPHATIVRDINKSTARSITDAELRHIYLDSGDDPRVGGNVIPFVALQYLLEEDLEEMVAGNPAGVVDLLMRLKESYTFWTDEDDDDFREEILAVA